MRVCLLCSVTSVHSGLGLSCSLFVKHLPMFAKCMKWCQKKLLTFGVEMLSFATRGFATSQWLFCRCFQKGASETFATVNRTTAGVGLPPTHSPIHCCFHALNGLTEQPPRES